jgi:hypothetical protein
LSRKERITEELGLLKVLFSVFFIVDVSLIAWLAQRFDNASLGLLIAALVVALVLSAAIIWVIGRAFSLLKELENL